MNDHLLRSLRAMALSAAGLCIALAAAERPSARGAEVPWITYEAEDMKLGGEAVIVGPPEPAKDTGAEIRNVVEMEASGRRCVRLTATGQSVQLTARAAANAIVVRYSIPDSADGAGLDSTLGLYRNGALVQRLTLTSRYAWRYGGYPFSNKPDEGKPRNFFDEVRLKGIPIAKGDKLKLQKDAADTASAITIDLVDLEQVAPPLPIPAGGGYLSVTDFGAVADDAGDDTAALQRCIDAARGQHKNVWVPVGTFVLCGDINNLSDIAIQGAGMWHTTFAGNPALYNTAADKRVRFNGGGNNIRFADFAITGMLDHRNDGEANDGFSESFGTGSSIARVWVEHTKTGAWLANAKGMTIEGCRFRNTIADGINLCVGVRESVVRNCTARGVGDDGFAIWPATYAQQVYQPGLNTISHCTAQLSSLGNGMAIYGGESNRIEDCLVADMPYGCGVLISGTFPIGDNQFAGTTIVRGTDLVRCGGHDHGMGWRAALQLCQQDRNITGVLLKDLNIVDSLSWGLSVIAPNSDRDKHKGFLAEARLENVAIPNFGLAVGKVHGVWASGDALGGLTIADSKIVEGQNDSATDGIGRVFAFTLAPGSAPIRGLK